MSSHNKPVAFPLEIPIALASLIDKYVAKKLEGSEKYSKHQFAVEAFCAKLGVTVEAVDAAKVEITLG